ncbi:MAG TPA: type II toxin-antitoxin system VapC family toxin [Polyangiaceae bacterium]|nr:type II toxin-antitoxin system VapC family toxin [Polyangiaceae bacterium]
MRLVLDASVAIAATRPSEPSYAAARAQMERALQGIDTIVVPAFFVVEVSGALARQGLPEPDVQAIVEPFTHSPHELVTIGPKRARAAQRVAMACKLRGPDALYVWLAAREAVPLCTLDEEILMRGAARAQAIRP